MSSMGVCRYFLEYPIQGLCFVELTFISLVYYVSNADRSCKTSAVPEKTPRFLVAHFLPFNTDKRTLRSKI